MHADVPQRLGDEQAMLLGERAVWLPQHGALLIADLHLGKGDVFRRAGIALPRGGTAEDLQRLTALLELHAARQLWILGDMLHGPLHATPWLQQWQQWRAALAEVDIHVVRGNHDRALQAEALGVRLHETSAMLGSLELRHEAPDTADGSGAPHVIAGHIHPLVRLPGLQRRWPVFWLRNHATILPAFSAFTAGVPVRPLPGERVVACVEGNAVALPAA